MKNKFFIVFTIICILLVGCLSISVFAADSTTQTSSNGLYRYKVDSDGQAIITSYLGSETSVIINRLDGRYQVKAIGDYAFANNTTLEKIELSVYVTSIGKNAFYGCSALTNVAFTDIGRLVSIGSYAFYDCTSLRNAVICSTLVEIGDHAFDGCVYANFGLSTANSLKTIGDYAFAYCGMYSSNLTITIPATVTELGYNAFFGCTTLSRIAVLSGNPYFSSDNGILYNKDMSVLVACPENYVFDFDTFIVPSTVKEIAAGAVSSNPNLRTLVLPEGLTKISGSAFNGCAGLTTVTLPQSLKTIGSYAFYNCSQLASVSIPENATDLGIFIFRGCIKLESASLPSTITEIPIGMFDSCTSLKTIVIPSTVKKICQYAFNYCSSLEEITIPDSVTELETYSFRHCLLLKSFEAKNVDTVGAFLFQDNMALKSVSLPKIKEITPYMFYGCTVLTDINLASDLASIGAYAFYGCDGLTSYDILPSVKYIGDFAFGNTSNISSFVIPSTVEYLGVGVLYGSGVKTVTIEKEITKIPDRTFESCSKLTTVNLPDSVTTIGSSCFANCVSLEEVPYIKNLEHVQSYAFSGCRSLIEAVFGSKDSTVTSGVYYSCDGLEKVVIPDNIDKIEPSAFYDCAFLEEVVFGKNVTYVGYAAFRDCSRLKTLKLNDKLNIISEYAFYQCSILTSIDMPKSVVYIGNSAFESTRWINLQTADFVVTGDGILLKFNGDPQSTTITFPSTVKRIPSYVIENVTSTLKSVIIPASVTQISKNAFAQKFTGTSTTTGSSYEYYRLRYITIYGVKGSYAESYAMHDYYTFEKI